MWPAVTPNASKGVVNTTYFLSTYVDTPRHPTFSAALRESDLFVLLQPIVDALILLVTTHKRQRPNVNQFIADTLPPPPQPPGQPPVGPDPPSYLDIRRAKEGMEPVLDPVTVKQSAYLDWVTGLITAATGAPGAIVAPGVGATAGAATSGGDNSPTASAKANMDAARAGAVGGAGVTGAEAKADGKGGVVPKQTGGPAGGGAAKKADEAAGDDGIIPTPKHLLLLKGNPISFECDVKDVNCVLVQVR